MCGPPPDPPGDPAANRLGANWLPLSCTGHHPVARGELAADRFDGDVALAGQARLDLDLVLRTVTADHGDPGPPVRPGGDRGLRYGQHLTPAGGRRDGQADVLPVPVGRQRGRRGDGDRHVRGTRRALLPATDPPKPLVRYGPRGEISTEAARSPGATECQNA